MNQLRLDDYLSGLERQISASVERLKQKNGATAGLEPESAAAEAGRYNPYSVQNYAYNLLSSGLSYQLNSSVSPQGYDAGYAAGSYLEASQVNREPTVLIDFMFEYNREFDFKV